MFRNKIYSSSISENSTFKSLFSYDDTIITERNNKSKKNRNYTDVNT